MLPHGFLAPVQFRFAGIGLLSVMFLYSLSVTDFLFPLFLAGLSNPAFLLAALRFLSVPLLVFRCNFLSVVGLLLFIPAAIIAPAVSCEESSCNVVQVSQLCLPAADSRLLVCTKKLNN
jgi:hypothetical protein